RGPASALEVEVASLDGEGDLSVVAHEGRLELALEVARVVLAEAHRGVGAGVDRPRGARVLTAPGLAREEQREDQVLARRVALERARLERGEAHHQMPEDGVIGARGDGRDRPQSDLVAVSGRRRLREEELARLALALAHAERDARAGLPRGDRRSNALDVLVEGVGDRGRGLLG